MKNEDIKDPLFRKAVEAIDGGDLHLLEELIVQHPSLVINRLDYSAGGYFKNPYLLWFIADNPIRHKKLPTNIIAITSLLLNAVRHNTPGTFQLQIDYTLGLVVTGSVPRECGVQIALIDLLIDEGAVPGKGHSALAHGNIGAAQRLIERGGELTLATAISLNRTDDIVSLAKKSTAADRETALVAAAFFGKPEMIAFILKLGVNVNAYPDPSDGFHSHATALHQAVFSGSIASVKILTEAGADLTAKDLIYGGTPLQWATYMQTEVNDAILLGKYKEIEANLQLTSGK